MGLFLRLASEETREGRSIDVIDGGFAALRKRRLSITARTVDDVSSALCAQDVKMNRHSYICGNKSGCSEFSWILTLMLAQHRKHHADDLCDYVDMLYNSRLDDEL